MENNHFRNCTPAAIPAATWLPERYLIDCASRVSRLLRLSRAAAATSTGDPKFIIFDTKFLMFNTELIIFRDRQIFGRRGELWCLPLVIHHFHTKFIIFNTTCIMFHTKFIIFHTEFIIFRKEFNIWWQMRGIMTHKHHENTTDRDCFACFSAWLQCNTEVASATPRKTASLPPASRQKPGRE